MSQHRKPNKRFHLVEPPRSIPRHGRTEILAMTAGVVGAIGVVAYGYISSKLRERKQGCEVVTYGRMPGEPEEEEGVD